MELRWTENGAMRGNRPHCLRPAPLPSAIPPLRPFQGMPADSTRKCPSGSAGGRVVPLARGVAVIGFGKVLVARLRSWRLEGLPRVLDQQ
jgi:hypothetical protein